LQLPIKSLAEWSKPLTGGLLVALVLLLNAMAACPELHELIHKDADSTEHHCAVTMFAHGQVDTATVEVSAVTPAVSVEITPQISFSVFSTGIENLPPGRAPPAILFSQV
jgi:hypothetical protein